MQNMGLTTWKGTDTLKSDMGVAKIYLSEEELRAQQSGRAVALHLMIARMGLITG
ncbi:virulence RhuM family protein [Acidithiobacillus ferrivorans]|uniref:virulence RhuM family protein n=1 Tax=Acidithiobacillus ferrivorans TaxID=160808 RepID=UPI001C06CD97|nr:virulence RhuM family protein [Acidithiobacillus ferrivorans]MBU2849807.1 virulence RhuM family protein [Acidithiobacillus ferrivorans]